MNSYDWRDKKGANELSKKLKPGFIQVITNFKTLRFKDNSNGEILDSARMFPRLSYLRLNETLIQTHLDIFEFLKPIFSAYVDNMGNLSTVSKSFMKRKPIV